jgi:hypothetical protein
MDKYDEIIACEYLETRSNQTTKTQLARLSFEKSFIMMRYPF